MSDAKEPLVQYGYRLSVRDDSAHRDAERAVIESALETREFYREGLGERGHPFPLSDLFEKVDTLRALEGDA